jgi:transporter family protein
MVTRLNKLLKNSGERGFVKGHGFSRAAKVNRINAGFSPRFVPTIKFASSQSFSASCETPSILIGMSWIGWALLSAAFAAATALLAKVGVEHVDSNLATAVRTTVVAVFTWGIALALGKHGEVRELDRRTLLFLALSGIATGLSWICYFRALQLGPASRVAPLDKLSVPLVMAFAWLLLGEKLTAAALIGGLLITAGAVLMVLS